MPITYGEIATVTVTDTPRYGRSASGYGSKIPTPYMVTLIGETRRRRVYAMCYGNAASFYIVRDGNELFIREWALEAAVEEALADE
jgi:hypothetical protein